MQIHTMQYPDGALKATFDNSSIIPQVVPTVYGAALIDPLTGMLLNPGSYQWDSPVSACHNLYLKILYVPAQLHNVKQEFVV